MAKTETKPASKEIEYVSRRRRQSFRVVLKDDKGNLIPELDSHGQQVFLKGKPVYRTKMVLFDQLLSASAKRGFVVAYKTKDRDEIAVLDALCANDASKVLRAEDYKKEQNPQAFAAEQRVKELEAELSRNEEIRKRNEELEEKIKELEAKAKAK